MAEETNLLDASDLTRGEKLYLFRKRLGYTQVQRSVDLGVGFAEYRAMELDEAHARGPYVTLRSIEEREVYTILRRRAGMTKGELAEVMGISAEWIRQMELGQAPIKRLQEYWESAR